MTTSNAPSSSPSVHMDAGETSSAEPVGYLRQKDIDDLRHPHTNYVSTLVWSKWGASPNMGQVPLYLHPAPLPAQLSDNAGSLSETPKEQGQTEPHPDTRFEPLVIPLPRAKAAPLSEAPAVGEAETNPTPLEQAAADFDHDKATHVDLLAVALMRAFAKAEPTHGISQHPASYIATFADMAKAAAALTPPQPVTGEVVAWLMRGDRGHCEFALHDDTEALMRWRRTYGPRVPEPLTVLRPTPEGEVHTGRLCQAGTQIIDEGTGDQAFTVTVMFDRPVNISASSVWDRAQVSLVLPSPSDAGEG